MNDHLKPATYLGAEYTREEICRKAYEDGWLNLYYKMGKNNRYSDKELFDLYEFGYEDATYGEYNFEG